MNDKSTTKNKYGWQQTPDWAGLDAYKNWSPEADPTIPYQYAKQERDFDSSFKNPNGPYTTPEMQRQMTQAGHAAIGQEKGQALRASQYDVNNQKGQQLGNIASLTRPTLTQTESETKSRPGLLSMAASAAGAAAGAAMM